jgi:subtilase family serine protease
VQHYGQDALQGATYVGPVTNAHLSISVLVHQQNAQGLVAYAQAVQNPNSGSYRQFLTPAQIATQFGASQADYKAAAQYFVNNGLAVAGWNQRMLLTVAGEQANMQKAFGTTFGLYQKNGQEFIAPMSQPHFLQQLNVDAVGGIVGYRRNHSYIVIPKAGQGFATGFSPSTVRAAFDYQGAYNSGYNGSGVILGIIATGPINYVLGTGNNDVDLNALMADTNTANAAKITQVDVTSNGVATGLNKSGCGTASCPFPYSGDFSPAPSIGPNFPEDGEAQLDTQQAATLAPGASVYFYLAYNAADCNGAVNFPSPCPSSGPNVGTPSYGIDEADPEIMQAIADDVADVISISYGGGEPQTFTGLTSGDSPYSGSYSQLEFAELEAEGVAVFVSSGDNGSANCFEASGNAYLPQQCVSYPAGDPNVTSVGGITANVNIYGQQTAPWLAWGISTVDTGYGGLEGSGGGSSAAGGIGIAAQAWQAAPPIGATSREQPDVSMIGDPSTGVAVVINGQIQGIGGTSVAAPEMAAMWADVLSACKANAGKGACPTNTGGNYWRLGNAAPYLYAIYEQKQYQNWTPSLAYDQVFYDIVYGDNQMSNPTYTPASPIPGYTAGPGYDMVTGVGVPYAGHLIDAITTLTSVP